MKLSAPLFKQNTEIRRQQNKSPKYPKLKHKNKGISIRVKITIPIKQMTGAIKDSKNIKFLLSQHSNLLLK